jgi:hypothetical protein
MWYIQDTSRCIAYQSFWHLQWGWGHLDSCGTECTFADCLSLMLLWQGTLPVAIVTSVCLSSCGLSYASVHLCKRTNRPCRCMELNLVSVCRWACCWYLQYLTNPLLFPNLSKHLPGPFGRYIVLSVCCGTCAKGGTCWKPPPWWLSTLHVRSHKKASRRFGGKNDSTSETPSNLQCPDPCDPHHSCGRSSR